MNCWDCKNFSCTTLHQSGYGSVEHKHCSKRHISIDKVKDAEECKEFEKGKSNRETWVL